jgi:hypothetical protein
MGRLKTVLARTPNLAIALFDDDIWCLLEVITRVTIVRGAHFGRS